MQLATGPSAQRAERQCQTVEVKQRSAQTCREAHVQMARPDLLLDTSRDKILAASELTAQLDESSDSSALDQYLSLPWPPIKTHAALLQDHPYRALLTPYQPPTNFCCTGAEAQPYCTGSLWQHDKACSCCQGSLSDAVAQCETPE